MSKIVLKNQCWAQKKVLSLVLCVAVMLSVMVMGAGAAFSDQDQIENTEAVNMCSALNIIGGYEDGSFHPERNIKRSEITKMVCVALNGGKEPNVSTNAVPTFTDVRGTSAAWAEGYIESCVAQGIVSGVGGGRFAPDGNVTGSQLAKMLLVALGYNSDNEGFTGNAWETNVNVRASQKGLYAGLETLDTSAAVTRDQAAQMVWNALNAYEVEYKTNLVTDGNGNLVTQITVQDKQVIGGNDTLSRVTLMEDKYEAETFVGTFEGNYDTGAAGKEGYIAVKADGDDRAKTFPYDFDLSYIGEEVKVIYKENKTEGDPTTLDSKDTIYGVVVTGGTSVVNATLADIDDDYNTTGKVSVNNKAYKVAKEGKIVTNLIDADTGAAWKSAANGVTDIEALGTTVNGNTVKFVLNDQSEIISAYVTTADLYKVTAVSGTKISIAGIGTIDTAENNTTVYSGIAKDDVVAVTALYNAIGSTDDATYIIEKAETVTGTVTGYTSTNPNKSIVLDGTTYKVYNEAAMKVGLTDDSLAYLGTNEIDEEFILYLVNGYVRAVQQVTEAAVYAVVNDVDTGTLDTTFTKPQVELVFADGTSKIVTLHKDSVILKDSTGHNDGEETSDVTTTSLARGEIVKYSEMSNGEYKIEEMNDVYYDDNGAAATSIYNADTKTLDGIVTAGDCVLFYTDNKDEMKATTIRSLDDIDVAANTVITYVTNSDGKVVAAFIDLNAKPSGASDTTVYGIVTTDHTAINKNGDPHYQYTIATNDGDKTVYVTTESLNKGDLVSFDIASDEIYEAGDFTTYTGANAANGLAVAVTEYSEVDKTITYANNLVFNGSSYEVSGKTTKPIDSDVKIVYIDADNDKAGDSGYGITEYDAVTGYANAVLVFENGNPTKNVIAIIVNTNSDTNVMSGVTPVGNSGTLTLPANANEQAITEAFDRNDITTVTVSGNVNGTINVPSGKALTIADGAKLGNTTLTGSVSVGDIDVSGTVDLSEANIESMGNVTVQDGASLNVTANDVKDLEAGTLNVAAGGALTIADSGSASSATLIAPASASTDARIQTAERTTVSINLAPSEGSELGTMTINGNATISKDQTWYAMIGPDAESALGLDIQVISGTLTIEGRLRLISGSNGSKLTVSDNADVVVAAGGKLDVSGNASIVGNNKITGTDDTSKLVVTAGTGTITGVAGIDNTSNDTEKNYEWSTTSIEWVEETP